MQRGLVAAVVGAALVSMFLPRTTEAKLAMEIVYDASGSMWAKIDDKERFVLLNRALELFLEKVPDDVSLALRVYGARQKGDCDDTYLAVPFATGNRDAVRAAVKKIKPLGKTPIQKSLLAAAEDLKSQDGTKIIVLVSDGKESCQGDPCDTARMLAETEKIQIDVVGFAIANEDTRRQLVCIATVGAGNYFEAANEADLNAGLSTAIGNLAPPPPQTGRINARVDRPLGVQAPTRGLKIEIFELNKPDAPAATFDGQNPVSADLPVGSYRVRVVLGDQEKSVDNVNLEANTLQKLTVDFPPLEGMLTVAGMSGSNPLGTRVICSALPAGQREAEPLAEQYGGLAMLLPEGNYDIRCSLIGASVATESWQNNVAIKPGEMRELKVVFNMGTLTARALGPASVLGDRQTYSIFPAGDRATKLAWSYCGSPVELPAGSYDILVEVGGTGQRRQQWLEGVRLTERQPVEVAADFRPGELLLQATTAGQNVGNEAKFTVYPPGEPRQAALGWSYSGVPLPVPAGDYDALVEYQPPNAPLQKQWVLGLSVAAGQPQARVVEFATGQILVHILAGGQDTGREGGFTLYLPGERDKPLAKVENHAPQTMPTGSYDVKAESYYYQYAEWRKDVVITKDRLTELSVDFPTGKIQVGIVREGKDLGTGATYYVFAQNEKFDHIAFAFSGVAIDLVPGVYDVKCTLGPTVKWKRGIFVDASETTKDSIEF